MDAATQEVSSRNEMLNAERRTTGATGGETSGHQMSRVDQTSPEESSEYLMPVN